MSDTRYHFDIEFVPDNPEQVQVDNVPYDGTYTEAVKFMEINRPDYLCREIVFHRCGEVLVSVRLQGNVELEPEVHQGAEKL